MLYEVPLTLYACTVHQSFLHTSLFPCNAAVQNAKLWIFIVLQPDQSRERKSKPGRYTYCTRKCVIIGQLLNQTLNSCKKLAHVLQNLTLAFAIKILAKRWCLLNIIFLGPCCQCSQAYLIFSLSFHTLQYILLFYFSSI